MPLAENAFAASFASIRPFLNFIWLLLEVPYHLNDWLLLSLLCPPAAVFAARGFSLSVFISSYYWLHCCHAFSLPPLERAAALRDGGLPALLGVGSRALGVPYSPRPLYTASLFTALLAVFTGEDVGWWPYLAMVAPPLALLVHDVFLEPAAPPQEWSENPLQGSGTGSPQEEAGAEVLRRATFARGAAASPRQR